MTQRIDLGDELADWSEHQRRDPRQKPQQPVHTPAPGSGSYVPLADLQAAGFNTTPPPGFRDGPGWRVLSAGGGGGAPRGVGGSWAIPTNSVNHLGGNGGATGFWSTEPGNLNITYTFDGGDTDD